MGRSHASAKAGVSLFGRTSTPGWTKRFLTVALATALVAVPSLGSRAVSAERAISARRGAQWIVDRQQSNGAFFGATQRVDQTGETLAAVVAGGITGDPVSLALGYIATNGQAGATRAAFTGRIIAGIFAGGQDPHAFGGVDYAAILASQYDQSTGAFESGDLFSNLLAANGALAANGSLPPQAIAYILSKECAGGGFAFDNPCAFGPDTDTSSLAVNVLVAAGQSADPAVLRAKSFLLSRQNDDGGFGFSAGFPPTSGDSTGLGLTLIAAIGEEAQSHPWAQVDGDDPVDALLALQDAAGGFKFSSADTEGNPFSTVNAIPGMAGRPYPIHPVAAPPGDDDEEEDAPPPAGDTTAPDTTISSGDRVKTRDRTPTFQFAADEVAVRFECSVDGGDFFACSSPFTLAKLGAGAHVFSVRAIDARDNVDQEPATDAFKVVTRRARRR